MTKASQTTTFAANPVDGTKPAAKAKPSKPNGVLATQSLPYVKILRHRTMTTLMEGHHAVPLSFTQHRREFRVVGKRLMRAVGGKAANMTASQLTGAQLRNLKISDNETLANALKKVSDRALLVEATADQYLKYSAAEKRLRTAVFKSKIAQARAHVAGNKAALAKLVNRCTALRAKLPGLDKRVGVLEALGTKAGVAGY